MRRRESRRHTRPRTPAPAATNGGNLARARLVRGARRGCGEAAHALGSGNQLPYPSVAHSHLLGGLPLADASFLGSSEPVQLIPFLLAHRDSFHPLALRLSRGTFYFGQLGTSHFAATMRVCVRFWEHRL